MSRFPLILLSGLGLVASPLIGQESGVPDLVAIEFEPGESREIGWPGLVAPIVVWLPKNFEAKPGAPGWPMAMWYHGTNGRPTLQPLYGHTDGNDWILVGMTYRAQGTFRGDPENIAAELALNQAVRRALGQRFPIDPKRTFVGGFSKGGWVSALLLEADPALAGGLVMGGGVMEESPRFVHPGRSVYVGIGEVDPNRAQSQRAARAFRSPVTRVTLDVWDELGHRLPAESDSLRQWLRVEREPPYRAGVTGAGIDPLVSEAIEWFDAEMARIRRAEAPAVDRYFALRALAEMPFFARLDEESRAAHAKRLETLAADPGVAKERLAETAYRAILEVESRDRLLGTLVICHEDYRRLAEKFPGTRFGEAAARAAKRTRELMPGQ